MNTPYSPADRLEQERSYTVDDRRAEERAEQQRRDEDARRNDAYDRRWSR